MGTEALTWRDLLVIVKRQPVGSALARARRGKAAGWNLEDYLLLAVWNTLRLLSWQQSGKGPKPKPIEPPDAVPETTNATHKGGGVSIEEANRRLGWTMPSRGA